MPETGGLRKGAACLDYRGISASAVGAGLNGEGPFSPQSSTGMPRLRAKSFTIGDEAFRREETAMTDAPINPRNRKPLRILYGLAAAYFALVALFLVMARFAEAAS